MSDFIHLDKVIEDVEEGIPDNRDILEILLKLREALEYNSYSTPTPLDELEELCR